jgi:hypothetical protein
MLFLQIGFLTALVALAIPIIIHLVFRPRARRASLGTLRFLQAVLAQHARRRRLMHWLLLGLRLGCLALIAFLFARPYTMGQSASDKRTTVLLIDQSASMNLRLDGERLIDRAVAAARKLVTDARPNEQFRVALFDHGVHPLGAVGEDSNVDDSSSVLASPKLLSLLAPPRECCGATDYGAALAWARDVLAKAPSGQKRMHIFTDLQQSGLAWSEVDPLPDDVVAQVHDLGRSAVTNVAVVEARTERSWLRPQEQTAIHATVYNGGPFTIEESPIVLTLAGPARKIELREQAKVEPGASQSVRFDLPPLSEGLWQGTVASVTEDDLPLDNQRYVAILASPPYQVLLVDGRSAESPALAATYFLDSSLRLAPPGETSAVSPFEPRQIAVDGQFPPLDKFDVVALADVGELSPAKAQQLKQFVTRGGGLVCFGGENVTVQNISALAAADLAPGVVKGAIYASDIPFRLKSWDVKHPIFAAFADPQLGDLSRLAFSACTEIKPAADASVLASFRDGGPAMIERRMGKGSILWIAVSADRRWSDWTSSRLYLPLVYQLLGYQTGLLDGGRVRQLVLDSTAESAMTPGIQEREGYSLVVNMSPRESETDRCSSDDFIRRFGLKIDHDDTGPASEAVAKASLGTELIDSELWPWLAGLLLVSLVLETIIANRTAA